MSDSNDKQVSRKLYSQIVSGYTPATLGSKKIYIKHFSDTEFSSYEEDYDSFLEEAKEKGLEEEGSKLKQLIELDHWSQDEENQIKSLELSISDAKKQLVETPVDQKSGVEGFVFQLQKKLYALERVKNELIGTTAETFAQRRNNERIILHSMYKDSELKIPFYNEEEFDNLSQSELAESISLYNKNMEFFTEQWIKKIAALPSFLNSFFLCNDDPVIFYGRPVIDLTLYQVDLFSKAKYFKSILSESEADGPSEKEYDEGMQAVVNWYDFQYSMIQGKRASEKAQAASQARQRGRR